MFGQIIVTMFVVEKRSWYLYIRICSVVFVCGRIEPFGVVSEIPKARQDKKISNMY